jgi:hypothetical protein
MLVMRVKSGVVQSALAFRHQMPAGFRIQRRVMAQKFAFTPPFYNGHHHTKNQQTAKDEIQNFHVPDMGTETPSCQGGDNNALR